MLLVIKYLQKSFSIFQIPETECSNLKKNEMKDVSKIRSLNVKFDKSLNITLV